MINGSVRNASSGLRRVFATPSTAAPIRYAAQPWIRTLPHNEFATHSAAALIAHASARRIANDIARSVTCSRMDPVFFATPQEFRAWLEARHADAREVVVGFHRKGTGRRRMAWPESVDEALCLGWLDGVRRSLADESYII